MSVTLTDHEAAAIVKLLQEMVDTHRRLIGMTTTSLHNRIYAAIASFSNTHLHDRPQMPDGGPGPCRKCGDDDGDESPCKPNTTHLWQALRDIYGNFGMQWEPKWSALAASALWPARYGKVEGE